ncbi:cytochrome c oxidase subunit 3 [Sanyastnella coralliicola]|uniref:cytochrome c oxidase subunit 3 n=1 Tax=Sanyastnella coralliicola TaxID=3069118 RepID=UPI0027B89A13|nr:cytochrome c oxidase subunit 3 [Longitalea sp. SCSIO 12813]
MNEDSSNQQPRNKKDVFADFDPDVKVRTKKMLMYFIIFAIVMLFGGFTSAYIVSSMGEFWVHINPPTSLWISNVIIIISSLTIWLALRAMKSGNKGLSMAMMVATLVLGVAFTLTQKAAWDELHSKGMGWTVAQNGQGLEAYRWNSLDKVSGEYGVDYYVHKDGKKLIYDDGEFYASDDVLQAEPITKKVHKQTNSNGSYIWALIGIHILHLVFGFVYLVINIVRISKGKINQNETISLYTNGMYWHFLGILWLYLFVFLFLIH